MNNESVTQMMPSVKELVTMQYTNKHWLQYYLNIWTRNSMAVAIDVETDKALKLQNPEEEVEHVEDSVRMVITVKERLEKRKILLQDYLDRIAGIKYLLSIADEEFEAKVLSKEALAVAEDMLPKEEVKEEEPTPEPTEEKIVEAIPNPEEVAEESIKDVTPE